MGVPKRVPSLNTQVEGNCKELGGDRAIHRCAAVDALLLKRHVELAWRRLHCKVNKSDVKSCACVVNAKVVLAWS